MDTKQPNLPALREAVAVPDIPGPRRPLCWKQDPDTMTRCDRAQHHAGLHTWEWAAITTALAEAEAELVALMGNEIDAFKAGYRFGMAPEDVRFPLTEAVARWKERKEQP